MIYIHKGKSGFTIVELLIVIVVIAILAAITIVAYSGIQSRAKTSSLQNTLAEAAKVMQTSYVDSGTYPTSFPSTLHIPSSEGISIAATGNVNTFCINGQAASGTITMYYDSTVGQAQTGVCSGNVITGSESGTTSQNLINNTDFSSGWSMLLSVTGQAMTTRAGTSSDPIPNRPVLVWTNNVARTTSYSVLNGPVNYSQLASGQTYSTGFWIRKTGSGYTGNTNSFGIMDGSTSNKAINTGASSVVNSTWTYISESKAAIGNGAATNVIYLPLTPGNFATTGWTLEFQGFDLHQQ